MQSKSKRWQLDTADAKKIGKSFLLGLTGFVLTWLTTVAVPALQESDTAWAIMLAAFIPVLVNAIRKIWANNNHIPDPGPDPPPA
jgi:hypothetical protein